MPTTSSAMKRHTTNNKSVPKAREEYRRTLVNTLCRIPYGLPQISRSSVTQRHRLGAFHPSVYSFTYSLTKKQGLFVIDVFRQKYPCSRSTSPSHQAESPLKTALRVVQLSPISTSTTACELPSQAVLFNH